jgi:hypothetical protein
LGRIKRDFTRKGHRRSRRLAVQLASSGEVPMKNSLPSNHRFLYIAFSSLLLFLNILTFPGCARSKPSPQPNALLPDLIVVPNPNGERVKNFTVSGATGQLFLFTIKNQGPVDAPASTASIRFSWQNGSFGPVEVPTFGLSAGRSDTLETPIPKPGCIPFCFFEIEADSRHQIDESDKSNNKQSGTLECRGPCR